MLVRFLARRIAVMAAAAAAAAFVIDGFHPGVSIGILLGGFIGVYKSRLNSLALERAVAGSSAKCVTALQLLSNMLLLAFLAVAALANLRLFVGIAIGLSLLPLYICFNAITEWMGFTHNSWGDIKDENQRR